MMKNTWHNLASTLGRKYPLPAEGRVARDCLLYFALVFLILLLLQPFGISVYKGSKFMVALLFGAMTFVCSFVVKRFIVAPLQKRVPTWRIWHQLTAVIAMVLIIGLGNYFLYTVLFHTPIDVGGCLAVLSWTFIIGVIITILSTMTSYQRHMHGQLHDLLEKTTHEQEGTTVVLHDNRVRGNDLGLLLNDLLYVEAQKNNVAVYYVEGGRLERREIQSTLSAVLDELSDYPNIFQCHRSFVVNLNSITSAKGNSNGYTLELGGGLATVQVSRSFVPKLKSFIS